MTHTFGRLSIGITVIVFGFVVVGCSQSGASGQSQAGFVAVQVNPLYMTVESRATKTLLDVNVTIKQVGVLPPFASRIPRLEVNEKRDLMLRDFESRDGTSFNAPAMRPKAIDVTAVDIDGAKFTMTAPW